MQKAHRLHGSRAKSAEQERQREEAKKSKKEAEKDKDENIYTRSAMHQPFETRHRAFQKRLAEALRDYDDDEDDEDDDQDRYDHVYGSNEDDDDLDDDYRDQGDDDDLEDDGLDDYGEEGDPDDPENPHGTFGKQLLQIAHTKTIELFNALSVSAACLTLWGDSTKLAFGLHGIKISKKTDTKLNIVLRKLDDMLDLIHKVEEKINCGILNTWDRIQDDDEFLEFKESWSAGQYRRLSTYIKDIYNEVIKDNPSLKDNIMKNFEKLKENFSRLYSNIENG